MLHDWLYVFVYYGPSVSVLYLGLYLWISYLFMVVISCYWLYSRLCACLLHVLVVVLAYVVYTLVVLYVVLLVAFLFAFTHICRIYSYIRLRLVYNCIRITNDEVRINRVHFV